jgi:ribonuclease HI
MDEPSFANVGAVIVYTDGGSDPNPGPGGWAALLCFPDHEVELCGNDPQTTNNRMEIEAALSALGYLRARHGPLQVDLYTDSQYLRQGITEWIEGWYARGWLTKRGQSVKNQALWRALYELIHVHTVRWHWTRGHAGDPLNERVDLLAREARVRLRPAPNGALERPDSGEILPTPAPGDMHVPTPSSEGASLRETAADRALPGVQLSVGVTGQGPKGGGWAAVLRSPHEHRMLHGRESDATSNALYLRAATEGLQAIQTPSEVTVYTVSQYLAHGAGQWAQDWVRRGWRTKGGKPVRNRPLWEALLAAARPHRVTWCLATQEGGEPAGLAEAKRLAAQEAGG